MQREFQHIPSPHTPTPPTRPYHTTTDSHMIAAMEVEEKKGAEGEAKAEGPAEGDKAEGAEGEKKPEEEPTSFTGTQMLVDCALICTVGRNLVWGEQKPEEEPASFTGARQGFRLHYA